MLKNNRGQVAVLDLFISALIFGLLVTTIMFTWNSYTLKIDKQIDYNTNLLRAYHITDLLTRFPGKPTSWEKYNEPQLGSNPIEIVGLAREDRILDPTKVSGFINLEYDLSREILGITDYDYYFKLTHIDGTDFDPVIESGEIINESEIVVTLTRYVIYNETEAVMEFWLQK